MSIKKLKAVGKSQLMTHQQILNAFVDFQVVSKFTGMINRDYITSTISMVQLRELERT